MKIALAQINPTIGDFEGNLQQIEVSLARAENAGVDLCVFPQMAITGYPPRGLLKHSKFVSDNLKHLDQLISRPGKTAAVVGYVRPVPNSLANRLENVAALIAGQEIVSTHVKSRLLESEDSDELVYFDSAPSVKAVDFGGVKIGICFYDDLLNPSDLPGENKERDPVSELVEQGSEVIVAIAASQFDIGTRSQRRKVLTETARNHSRPVLFVNQVGGDDEIVLDGGSIAIGPDGEILASAFELKEDFITVDIETMTGDQHMRPLDDEDALTEALVLGTRDYTQKSGFKSVVLELGGDIGSSVVAAIAARALGPENVFGVILPSRFTSDARIEDAFSLAHNLGIHSQVIELDPIFQAYAQSIEPALSMPSMTKLEGSTGKRIRAMTLMSLSNAFGHLVMSTFNRSQLYIGKTALSGDMAGGLAVISDVSRTTLERIALRINVKHRVIPSAILDSDAQITLASNGGEQVSYTVIDAILERLLDRNLSAAATVSEGFDEATVSTIARLVRVNEHKRRQAPPGIKISTQTRSGCRIVPLGHQFSI